jgi:membrane-associated protease RseP (regulator of RpoE activity)
LALAAALNLFLFLFNLLPVLPLDGGHVAGALFEGSRRTWARMRGKPDPGPVDVARLLPVAYVVAAVLVGVGVIVIWADLVRPLSFT